MYLSLPMNHEGRGLIKQLLNQGRSHSIWSFLLILRSHEAGNAEMSQKYNGTITCSSVQVSFYNILKPPGQPCSFLNPTLSTKFFDKTLDKFCFSVEIIWSITAYWWNMESHATVAQFCPVFSTFETSTFTSQREPELVDLS